MFLPQTAEVDIYDDNEQQIDDINSVTEFFAIALGLDSTADDEDDDKGKQFEIIKTIEYFHQQQITIVQQQKFLNCDKNSFAEFKANKIASISYDIIAPPPEA